MTLEEFKNSTYPEDYDRGIEPQPHSIKVPVYIHIEHPTDLERDEIRRAAIESYRSEGYDVVASRADFAFILTFKTSTEKEAYRKAANEVRREGLLHAEPCLLGPDYGNPYPVFGHGRVGKLEYYRG